MIVFLFYLAAISLIFALCAALADFIAWLHPEWMAEPEQAEPGSRLEDAKAKEGTGSS